MDASTYFKSKSTLVVSSPSLAETTAQHILEAICEGKLSPDDPFPSQYQFTEWLGVSRTVIREATQILISKGVIDVKHGKRMTIRPPSYEQISNSVSLTFRRANISVFDVLELRKVLEVEVAALAAKRRTQADIEEMEKYIGQMEVNLQTEEGYVDADVAFHKAIFHAAQQPAFDLVLSSLNNYLLESRKKSYSGDKSTRRAIAAHIVLKNAIASGSESGARKAMKIHLDETAEDLIAADANVDTG